MTTSFLNRFKQRPLSWSQLSSFMYSPEQWYETYVLGKKQSSKEMIFGSTVDKKIQVDPLFLPKLPRYPLMQHKMSVVFNGIPMVGLPDGLDLETFKLADYKTGKKEWTQKRADETGQLTLYLLLVYITYKIHPEKFDNYIHWLPTVETGAFEIEFAKPFEIKTFKTKRTMADILKFGQTINETVKEMEKYLSTRA